MPAFPDFAQRISSIGGSVFERFGAKMRAKGSDLMKLHIGDTALQPVFPLPIDADFLNTHRHFHHYGNTFGIGELREALLDKIREDNFPLESTDNVMVSAGASNALSAAMMSLVDPGDEVLVLTPAWPFFFGMVRVAGGSVREAPLYTKLFDDPAMDIAAYLESLVGPRCTALYVNTPNNPSGKVLDRSHLQQIADFARRKNLWVISDEAYDNLTFDGREHISIAGLPGMQERTLTMFTFSKIFMLAGFRLGFCTGSADAIRAVNKSLVHQIYCAPVTGQYMLTDVVQSRHTWMQQVSQRYQELRDITLNELDAEVHTPEGGYFAFFPIRQYLSGRPYWQVIEECLDAGVALAPGKSFGKDFSDWVRICFTGETPERLRLGLQRLNNVLHQKAAH